MLPAVEAMGGEIVECAVLVDRSGGRATLTSPTTGRVYPLRSLWQLDLPTYEPGPATCPLCARRRAAPRAREHGHRRVSADRGRLTRGSRSRNIFVLALVGVIAVAGAAAFVLAAGRRCVPARRRHDAVVGVVVAVDAAGLDRRPRLHAPDDRRPDARRSGSAELENGAEFPPGHLAEHQADRVAGPRLLSRRRRRAVAIRLEDAT